MNTLWITIFGFLFLLIATALGASVVFFFKREISSKWNALFLGLASGVMLAASVWSLLLPAIEQAERTFHKWAFLPTAVGLVLGGVVLSVLEKIQPTRKTPLQKQKRLFLAVTLHNIPEGLAVGFAYGAAALTGDMGAYISALMLAVGIGIQNFPEGIAVALPLRSALNSRKRAFFWGALSGLPEPIFAITGYFLALWLEICQPWLLSFAAGAMIFVVAQDLIPEAMQEETRGYGAWGVLIGFIFMMVLDVALG